MFHRLFRTADDLGLIATADAHCDIPCKIYDPAVALIAALSVVRMMDVLAEAASKPAGLERDASIARSVAIKELEAAKVKDEIRVIWGDYFKAPQIEAHPKVHELTHSIMMCASRCKQGVNRADGEELVELVNQFAEMFWQSKGVATERRAAPYPPGIDVVRPA
ncbi:MAG: superoxide dismutase, Ni [Pseudomonadota bacterium]